MPDELDQDLIGTVGLVSVPITKHRMGEVMVAVRGGTEAFGATADQAIPKNSRVVVIERLSGRTLSVTPLP